MQHAIHLEKIERSPEEWRRLLTQEQYHVTREKGTEHAFTGAYWDHKEKGVYACVCCGLPLFDAAHKFDSGTGWPSYSEPVHAEHVLKKSDLDSNMVRTEVLCAQCGAHLGHVFGDGPPPTGLRYCINSLSLIFHPASEA